MTVTLRDRNGWTKEFRLMTPLVPVFVLPDGFRERIFMRDGRTRTYREYP